MGVPLDEAQVDLLCRFSLMLLERNTLMNLTSITSPEGVLTLHMLDSLSVGSHLGEAGNIIDVGTGGGFPGIPLAVAFPDRHFTLIDGTQKKIHFVAECVEALGIRNVTAIAARAENMPKGEVFDVVVVRAVGQMAGIVHNAGKLVAPQGRLLAMKGRLPEEELSALPRGWRVEVEKLSVPGLDAERHLVSLTRTTPASAGKGKPAPG